MDSNTIPMIQPITGEYSNNDLDDIPPKMKTGASNPKNINNFRFLSK